MPCVKYFTAGIFYFTVVLVFCLCSSEFRCDFETHCAWEWPKNSGYEVVSPEIFSRLQNGSLHQTGPLTDADNSTYGHFLYHFVKEPNTTRRIEIKSPWLTSGTQADCEVQFWLHMFDMTEGRISVVVRTRDVVWETLIYPGNSRNMWEKLPSKIGSVSQPFQLVLEIMEGDTAPAHLAIDNIQLVNCETNNVGKKKCELKHFLCSNQLCIDRSQVCDINRDCMEGEDEGHDCDKVPSNARCTFEDGMCGWTNIEFDDSEWKLQSGPTPLNHTGPLVDHTFRNTSGKYLWAEFHSRKAAFGHRAILNSAIYDPPPLYHIIANSGYYNSCEVRFFYHMYGAHMGELLLFCLELDPSYPTGRKIFLWRSYGDQGELWKRQVVTIPKITHNFQLQFQASRGLRHLSDVAIDDVSLSPECFGIGVPSEINVQYQATTKANEVAWEPSVYPPPALSNVSKGYTLTTCGARGRYGPINDLCKDTYSGTSTRVSVIMEDPFKGVQMWTVPKTGKYTVFVYGAGGGEGVENRGTSRGSFVRATFNWVEGEVLFFLIGQKGVGACVEPLSCNLSHSRGGIHDLRKHYKRRRGGGGGGGGATFIFRLDPRTGRPVPLVIAAGGGGLSHTRNDDFRTAVDPNGRGITSNLLTTNGRSSRVGDGAGGGGGWNDTTQYNTSGLSLIEGALGGQVCQEGQNWKTNGGFGGGGGGCSAGGGGGGYKGGNTSYEDSYFTNGRGGTSYVNPEAFLTFAEPGSHEGDGKVDIAPAHTDCSCEYMCVLLDKERQVFHCICPDDQILQSDGITCLHDNEHPEVTDHKSDGFHLATHHLVVIILCILVTVAVILFFCVLAFNWYRTKVNRNMNREPLNSPDLQLTWIRQNNGGMVTEYNPNYEFGGSTYTIQDLPEIPRENLTLVKALGQGAFGEVYEGYLSNVPDEPCNMAVAIKTLPEFSSSQSELDFQMEALIMSKFNHSNIVGFIGVCFEKMPRFIVLELLTGGDLKSFLRDSRPKPDMRSSLSMLDLLALPMDVAKGCQYLEQNHFIHRDIAARNCLLTSRGPDRVVKISDFGMARDVYRADYYRKGGKATLPVKWMPPEAFLDGIFTSKTDTWSFGILLWEVMSLGYIPYPGRGNQEVIQLVTSGGRLEPPRNCPSPVYRIMTQCWHQIPDKRPNFSTIIERLGYCMQDPDVINAPLPVFRRPPSSERDITVMRPTDGQNICLQVQRPKNGLNSPGSADILMPMPSSSYSVNTDKTEVQSSSSEESLEKLLHVEDPSIHRHHSDVSKFKDSPSDTWETSFVEPGTSQTASSSQSLPNGHLRKRPNGYSELPAYMELPPRPYSYYNCGTNTPKENNKGKGTTKRTRSLKSLDTLPIDPVKSDVSPPGSHIQQANGTLDTGILGSSDHPVSSNNVRQSNGLLDVVALRHQSSRYPLAYMNVDVNSNTKYNLHPTETGTRRENNVASVSARLVNPDE
ncbi:leukocyte tyrosine kinase receptor-like isoform X1 [Tachypleus tridentatus]|uniref:leukocyte tyrosine kinase receptor-like isoform X1 n=1 Tax=Tachypleus tridentatus TaxID=6853 RepID=UPI003FD4541E